MARRLLPLVAAILAFAATGLAGRQESFTVESVPSGDVAVLKGLGPVRLIGMEIPAAWAREAKAFMAGVLLDPTVRLEFDEIRYDTQKRVRGYLYLEDGRLANLEIVRMGYAHAYLEYPFRERERFRAGAIEARDASRGVWAAGLPGLATVPASTAASVGAGVMAGTARDAPSPRATPAPAARQRCAATTQRGTQCLRMAQPGRAFCWQHG